MKRIKLYDAFNFFLLLLSGAAFGVTEYYSKEIIDIPMHQYLMIRNLILTCLFALVMFLSRELMWPSVNEIALIALTALFGPLLARILFMYSLRRIDLSRAILFTQIEPLATALGSFVVFSDVPMSYEWAGGFLVVVGCVGITRGRKGTRV